MATVTNTIEVPIPASARANPQDVEVLTGLFQAIAAMHFEAGRTWLQTQRALERNGWEIRRGLQWHVEARRGRELEQACGLTLDEAFATIWQVAGAEPPTEGTP